MKSYEMFDFLALIEDNYADIFFNSLIAKNMPTSIISNLPNFFTIFKNNFDEHILYFKFSNNELHIWLHNKLLKEDENIDDCSFLTVEPHVSLNCTLNSAENIINLELFTNNHNYPIYIPFKVDDQDIKTDVIYKINMAQYTLINKLLNEE